MGLKFCFGMICGVAINLSKDQFPDLFKMARFSDATVRQMVSWNGNQNRWNIIFLRSPSDWEEESILNLLALLANTELHQWAITISFGLMIQKGSALSTVSLERLLKDQVNFILTTGYYMASKAPTKAWLLASATTTRKVP